MTPEENIELSAEALRDILTPDELEAWKKNALRKIKSNPEAVDALAGIPPPNINGALPDWHFLGQPLETAGSPDPAGVEEIKSTAIPAIDRALRFITKPQSEFFSTITYLLQERGDAIGIADARAKSCDEAAELLRQAAQLLSGADNKPLAHMVEALAPWTERAKYGTVRPVAMIGAHPMGTQDIDAGSAARKGKRGNATRAAAVVRMLVPFFPDTPDFWSNGGYALIAELAQLCGAKTATKQYVRQTIEQAKRTAEPKPEPRRDNSIIGLLLSKPKI